VRLLTAFENKSVTPVADLVALHDSHFRDDASPVGVFRQIERALQATQLQIATSHVHDIGHKLIPMLGDVRQLTDLVSESLASEKRESLSMALLNRKGDCLKTFWN